MKTYAQDSAAAFGKRLTEALVSKNGGNQSELARVLGCSPQAANKWCAGVQFPREKYLHDLAAYLDVSVEWLRFGKANNETEVSPPQFLLIYAKFDEMSVLSTYRELSENGKRQFKIALEAAERLPPEALPAKIQRA